ncbi:hypothetical protein G9P44_000256 [Scheffersomyces stipitis]|nr:hypothetical protein G9P44_000256 [Scheffersomyces stipitis]
MGKNDHDHPPEVEHPTEHHSTAEVIFNFMTHLGDANLSDVEHDADHKHEHDEENKKSVEEEAREQVDYISYLWNDY